MLADSIKIIVIWQVKNYNFIQKYLFYSILMKNIAIITVFSLIFTTTTLAQTAPVSTNTVPSTTNTTDAAKTQAETDAAAKKLEAIQKEINASKSTLKKSVNDTSLLESRLEDASELAITLESQLKSIDEQYEYTQNRIILITDSITKNEQKLEALLDEIAILVRQIESQKEKFKDIMTLIYIQSDQVGFFDKSDLQTMKLLLSNDSVSSMLEKADNLSMLELALGDLLDQLETSKNKLEDDKNEVEVATKELKDLKKKLDQEKLFLALQKESKEKLLAATKGEEKLYEELLQQARQEQISIRREFLDLMKIYSEYQSVFGINGFGLDDFSETGVLGWPISPSIGISAYFRDPSYKKALGVAHNAIDIRAPQATEIAAPADGVVLKVKGGEGNDYHYVVLGHNEEVMTLYGHMYDIFVLPGQTVKRGEIIGLSGGLPGSRGAGWLTTGPHLHFEVFKNGSNVDPLDYLDLTVLPEKYRP
jgi:murein DD-endopeptidase MepM/ murein hydrolase activator NlpD